MPAQLPPVVDLFFTRGSTYHDAFAFPGRGPDLDIVSVVFKVRRRDAQISPILLTITADLTFDPSDEDEDLMAIVTATPAQTAALPAGQSHYELELREQSGAVIFRVLEGRFIANE